MPVLEYNPLTGRVKRLRWQALRLQQFANVCYDFWAMFTADPKKMWLDWLKKEVKE